MRYFTLLLDLINTDLHLILQSTNIKKKIHTSKKNIIKTFIETAKKTCECEWKKSDMFNNSSKNILMFLASWMFDQQTLSFIQYDRRSATANIPYCCHFSSWRRHEWMNLWMWLFYWVQKKIVHRPGFWKVFRTWCLWWWVKFSFKDFVERGKVFLINIIQIIMNKKKLGLKLSLVFIL